jgi:hypothetical protein
VDRLGGLTIGGLRIVPLGSFIYSLGLKERSMGMIPASELRGKPLSGILTDGMDTAESELGALGGAKDEREETWLEERLVVVLDASVRIAPLMTGSEVDSG